MWRKPQEEKPSSESYNQPISAPVSSAEPAPASTPVSASVPAPAVKVAPQPSSIPSVVAVERTPAPDSRVASRITSGLKVHGEISGSTELYIDGEVQGKIRLGTARISVGPNARVQADIDAGEIVINGAVQGNVKASESATFGSSSRMVGSILTPRIGIDDGARVRGKVETIRRNPVAESSSAVSEPASNAPETVSASAKTA